MSGVRARLTCVISGEWSGAEASAREEGGGSTGHACAVSARRAWYESSTLYVAAVGRSPDCCSRLKYEYSPLRSEARAQTDMRVL